MKKPILEKTIIRSLLHYDPLDEAERKTGKSYKENKDVSALGWALMMENSQNKNELLDLNDDTKLSNELDNYLRIVKDEGFDIILKEDFLGYDNFTESLFVLWNNKDGVLLCFDTYRTKDVNGGHFYYNWKPDRSNKDWYSLTSSGHLGENDTYIGHHDCREALRLHLSDLRENGTFVKPWIEQPFLWLLHYGDTHDSSYGNKKYDYEKINASRIAKFPKNVRRYISGK